MYRGRAGDIGQVRCKPANCSLGILGVGPSLRVRGDECLPDEEAALGCTEGPQSRNALTLTSTRRRTARRTQTTSVSPTTSDPAPAAADQARLPCGGTSSATTGGGTWETFDAGGGSTGSGTYSVTGLVRWEQAPGTFPAGLTDAIGNAADAHPGLAILRVAYSDGSHGTLVVSCNLVGTPGNVFEGVTASKGFADYFNRVAPVGGVNANRTVFHTQ